MTTSLSTVIFRPAAGRLPRAGLRQLAAQVERTVAGGRHFTVLITTDAELRRLNRQFLGRDYPTDVLSFPDPAPDGFLGEIAISAERAAEQARERGHTRKDELGILLLHGVLHLLGMDHERDRGAMARAERRHRKRLGLPAGLIERRRR
jgi:probable rRNA maturation factor